MTVNSLRKPAKNGGAVLVTGGAGFIGSHLVESLLAEGCWLVVVVDNFDDFYSPGIKRANVAPHLSNPNFRLYEADIRDKEALRDIFSSHRFNAVVHLAGRAGVRPSLQYPHQYMETNVTGTLNLLDCAKDFDVPQFLLGSSSSVYGLNAQVPFAEDCKTSQPISPYAATKMSAELLCHTYSHLYGIRCVSLRFFTVYGPRQRPDLAIHKFARMIYEGKPIPVFGDGSARRDYTYVDDIIQGVRAAMDYQGSMYEVFNLGESQTISLNELIGLIEENLGTSAVLDRRGPQAGDMAVTFADISKSSSYLGYKPTTQIHSGIPKFVQWFLKERAQQQKAVPS
jgi:UDP-glucuronate 4-epimerase